MKIAERYAPMEYMVYKNQTLEFVEPQGNTALVWLLREKKNIPMQYLEPVTPDMERLLVTVISGDRMGKIFRVLTYSAHECKLRDTSIYPIRRKDDFMMETRYLVQVFPSK